MLEKSQSERKKEEKEKERKGKEKGKKRKKENLVSQVKGVMWDILIHGKSKGIN